MRVHNCPVCALPLVATEHEKVKVHRCGQCHGMLLDQARADGVKRNSETSQEQLHSRALEEAAADTLRRIRCPRCRGDMRKERMGGGLNLNIDLCDRCELAWFDGGELAMAQLAYTASQQGLENQELQRRVQAMTPEERQSLKARIEALPERSSLVDGLQEWLGEMFSAAGLSARTWEQRHPIRAAILEHWLSQRAINPEWSFLNSLCEDFSKLFRENDDA